MPILGCAHSTNQIRIRQNSMSLTGTKVCSKYVVGPKIGSGSFGEVYVVNLINTTEIYALKKEDEKTKNSQLLYEGRILKLFDDCVGFSKVYWQGTQNRNNLVVIDLMGPSLEDLFELCGKKFSIKTTIMLADQMLQRIEVFHGKSYVHRDIKPENFLMGLSKDSHILHLIDFGLSKKYRDFKTHQHISYKQNKNLTGTARYASINAHLGIEQSRRDDLEAIGYVLLYLCQGYLPWQGIKANNKNEKYQKIMEKKMSIPIQVQCSGLPLEFSTYLNYCRSLKFDDKPDYLFLRRMFRELLEKTNQRFDYQYDWTLIPSSRMIDNGKIKIELRGKEKQNEPNHLNDLMDVLKAGTQSDGLPLESHIQSKKSSFVKSNKQLLEEDSSEEGCDLLEGEQNIDEQEGVQGDNLNDRMEQQNEIDLEEKRYNLMYDDEQI